MTPDDVVAALPELGGEPLERAKLLQWMESADIEVCGALYHLLGDKRITARIEPPITFADYYPFAMRYLERCIVENPDGEWGSSRYEAAHDLSNWMKAMWHDENVPRSVLADVKARLAKLYKQGDTGVRDGVLNGTLEHVFEDKKLAQFFKDWEADPELVDVYRDALLWRAAGPRWRSRGGE